KPVLDEKTLDARLLSDFKKYQNRDFLNALSDLLPQKLIAPLVRLSGIDARKKVNAITREERLALLALLKRLPVKVRDFRPVAEAIITKGGVALREISPRTMASKKAQGLYFAGEVLDLDAYTGGFNLQIAFSTAVLAGESAACMIE
ncbi:MAG: NAD(P)/FAD-dependent oxidoreductase, partial [Clostridia bacterium]|nr:NAD(P)/FAD-dependent oxidoreductase [Clostridia bacterium]